MKLYRHLPALALLLAPGLAFAHPGHQASGLMAGLAHPLLGLDHLLTLFAVGLWAAQQQGSARWALPLTFVLSMIGGGLLGFTGMQLPQLETGIAASVLVSLSGRAFQVRRLMRITDGCSVYSPTPASRVMAQTAGVVCSSISSAA